jgi:predicted GH43/DUF377 family glycosyl hydrolase
MKLTRYEGNPILSPCLEHPWEDLAVFNPAVWFDAKRHEFLMLYRDAESHPDYKCSCGLARSTDGFHFERVSDQPVLGPSVEYLVIQKFSHMLVCLAVFVSTSVVLKFTWYDRLGPGEMYLEE